MTQRPYPSVTHFREGRRSGTTRTVLVYTAGWTNSSAAGKCLISSHFLHLLKRADIDPLLSRAHPGFGCISENKGSDKGMLFYPSTDKGSLMDLWNVELWPVMSSSALCLWNVLAWLPVQVQRAVLLFQSNTSLSGELNESLAASTPCVVSRTKVTESSFFKGTFSARMLFVLIMAAELPLCAAAAMSLEFNQNSLVWLEWLLHCDHYWLLLVFFVYLFLAAWNWCGL